jgi:hypothetical protein
MNFVHSIAIRIEMSGMRRSAVWLVSFGKGFVIGPVEEFRLSHHQIGAAVLLGCLVLFWEAIINTTLQGVTTQLHMSRYQCIR